MSRPHVEPVDATLGAVVTGVGLACPDEAEWKTIESAFLEFAVLVFPGQQLSADEQVAFGRRFGEIEHLYGRTGFVPISNQRRDGSLLEDDAPAMQVMKGNEGWHTDSSYMALAAKASLLSAEVVPPTGGETEWADMRAAHAALDDATRDRIAGLGAHHSLRHSQAKIGHTDPGDLLYGFSDDDPPLRPLVKIHPVTGRPSLFIGRHAYGIPGLPEADSEALLDELLTFACQPPRVFTHRWRPGDLVVWDNRCVLHRARPFDHGHPRVMRHTRIAGDPKTEMAPAPQ
jgi:alpha-ketoglutarate-dependent taurine dioxygenase